MDKVPEHFELSCSSRDDGKPQAQNSSKLDEVRRKCIGTKMGAVNSGTKSEVRTPENRKFQDVQYRFLIFPKQFTVEVFNSFLNRCPALSTWWCPAFRLSRNHFSPLIAIHLFLSLASLASLAGGARLSGCLKIICFQL